MRRRQPSGHRVDAKQAPLPSHSFGFAAAPDARSLLTPSGDAASSASGVYEEANTPTLGGPSGKRPTVVMQPSSSRGFSYVTLASSRRLVDPPPAKPPLSTRALAALNFAADMIFSLCLAIAAAGRANFVSFYYLLVFCFGVVFSLQSRAVTFVTLLVAVAACAGHVAAIFLFKSSSDSTSSAESVAAWFGFGRMHDGKDYAVAFGFDALVVVAAGIHYFYTLRRIAAHRQRQQEQTSEFDLFEMGEQLLNQGGDAKRDRKRSLLQSLEVLCSVLLFVTAVAVPAFAPGVFYLLLLHRLIRYTFFTRKVTLGELAARTASPNTVSRDASMSTFLGLGATRILLILNILFIALWYLSEFDQVRSHKDFRTAAKYCGFGDLRSRGVEWQYFVLAGSQLLLLLCSAKLYNLHVELEAINAKKNSASRNVRASARSIYSNAALDLEVVEFEDGRSPYNRPQPQEKRPADVHELLKSQSLIVRIFVREGGLLFGSVAAIVWCVSYPSYASAPLMGLAFLTLALYGLSSPSLFAWAMLAYGTCLSVAEYVSNLTIGVFGDHDFTSFGLRGFEYPILDVGVHNICLVVIYLSLRMHRRYHDVLVESTRQRTATRFVPQTPMCDDSNSADPSQQESSDYLAHADIRNQMRRGGLQVVIQFWLSDAKRVFFTHLDALVLLTILIVALSTPISFIQIGYLALAVLLILFFEHRRQFWRILLLYALAACFAVFIRNVECGEDDTLELVGLQCYEQNEFTWNSLWPTLFSAQLLIIFELVFQLVIYVANKETIEERMRMRDQDRQNPLFFISRLTIELDNWFRIFGVLFCYVAFVVVALQYEQGTTRLNTTVIGAIQLILCFLLLGNHLGGFPTAPRTSLRLKILWSLALLVEILILVSRYLYQFTTLSDNLKKYIFSSDFMTAQDFGYKDLSSTGSISGLFLYLLPTTIVMSLCFWQLSSMMKVVQPYEFFTSGQSRMVDRIRFALDTVKQLVISFSATALVVVTMYVALDDITFIGELYVLVIVLGRPLTGSWKALWRPLFWISAFAAVLKYLIQLSIFNPDEANVDGEHVLFSPGDDSDWIGTIRLYERYSLSVGASKLWDLVSGQLLVMLMCFFQRMAEYWDSGASAKRQQKLDDLTAQFELNYARQAAEGFYERDRTSSCEADEDDADTKYRAVALDTLDDEKHAGVHDTASTKSIDDQTRRMAKETSNTSREEDTKDFFGCLREFCMTYASKASVNITTLLLTISCFVHRDVISVVYMLLVYGMMYAYPSTVCRRWWLLAIMLSLVITLEYSVILWLPPFLDIEMETTVPWSWIPDSYEQWFLMSNQHEWALMSDFVTLLSVYLLPESDKFSGHNTPTDIDIKQYEDEYAEVIVDQEGQTDDDAFLDATTIGMVADKQYAVLTRKHPWYYIESMIVSNWLPLMLLLVFVFGTTQGGLVSIVYLWASMTMLYRLDETRAPLNQWIHHLRKFNWAHLFVIIILNTPYVADRVNRCALTSSTSESTTSETDSESEDCMTVTNLLGVSVNTMPYGLIVMCVLISIQCEILVSPTYPKVLAMLQNDQDRAPLRREEIIRAFFRRRTAKWYEMKKDKNAAIQRLKIIVSKLVHKVEELMDIAMGLHHNLPPTAPTKPIMVECSQNSATISWEQPATSFHKIRYYRISRQRYPSLTLLGDFGDIVEVKGSVCQATIEGLRPGTLYQFKVCAVSRMGEGPFSVASDPISIKSLNLDGSSTAGWMKYRREPYPPSRWAKLFSWLKSKYLHRYVVIDSGHLIYYRDEEMALKHRSRARRKRVKTSFKWRDVVSVRLSDNKVQFDDMSPTLYCFEIVARHSRNRGDTKYTFQPEIAKEFNMFLQSIAFAVPRDALDENVITFLKAKNLPNPLDIVPPSGEDGEGNENFDEDKSEWSSVTGDESTLGDVEDHEFDESPNKFAWRIPLYNFLYKCQSPAFQLEAAEYDEEDVNEPNVGELWQLMVNVVRSRSCFLTCLMMVVAFAFQTDLLNLGLVFAVFGYIILESPRPSSFVWIYLMKYVCCILALRYIFQLSIFCTGMTEQGYYYPSFQPYCTSSTDVATNAKSIQPNVLLGLYKFDGLSIDSVTTLYEGMQWDFYVLLFILWHQRELMLQGFWYKEDEDVPPAEASERFQSEAIRGFRGSMNSSRDSVDDAFLDEQRISKKELGGQFGGPRLPPTMSPPELMAAAAAQASSRGSSRPGIQLNDPSSKSIVSSTSHIEVANDLAAEMLEEIQAQEIIDEQARKSAARLAAVTEKGDDDTVAKPVGSDEDPDDKNAPVDDDNIVSEQVAEDEDTEEVAAFLARKKPSWLESKAPKLHAYFKTVVCEVPAQWDKDIHAAITGEKPGRDYYSVSLAILLLSTVFAVVLFEEVGEADSSDTSAANADSRLTSSDMISGYLVLLVFLELVFIIWDRVAYVCGSLTSKLVLQYLYTIFLHLCVWWLIPEHTNIYFQQRPALVVFYFMQSAFLWFSALQIRYGYPVYRGSRYNYTTETFETKLNEKVFGLVMSAPFLFEMRALLDYICTKTSLSWSHWVMLEDTAAHLFQIKMEMRGRVEEADVLQGKKRQPIVGKLLSAGVMLLFLLVCLIGPLALFSSINPSTTENEVTLTTVVFGVEDQQGTLNQLYSNSDSNSPNYAINRNTDGATVQRVEFDTFSRDVWTISPPRMNQLVEKLQSTSELNWTISFTFDRPGPTDYEEIDVSYSRAITDAQRNALIPMIKQTLNDDKNVTLAPISVEALFPPIVQLTAKDGVLDRSTTRRAVNVTKHSSSSGETWWTLEPIAGNSTNSTSAADSYCSDNTPFCLIAVSDKIVQGLTTLGIDSYGLTAVYVFVVVTIGSAVKGFFRGAVFQIQYSELPAPDDVLELVEGIYIAREEKYVGHLKDEVRIFETLVRVLRSPETLLKITGTNVLHIPSAKEKLD